jgi:hypothetical protein
LENDEQKLLKGGCATSFWKSLTFFFQVSKKLLTNQDKCFLLWYPNSKHVFFINPLNAELNPICCLLALLGAHHFLHVSRIRVNTLKCGYGNIVMCLQEYALI